MLMIKCSRLVAERPERERPESESESDPHNDEGKKEQHLANCRKHKGLVAVVPVGSHAKVHFVGAGVLVERLRHPQNRIIRTLRNI